MNSVFLNGNPVQVPLIPESSFCEVLSFLNQQIDPQVALISTVRIDGIEVPNTEDRDLAATPVSHFGKIEIFTSHPKEIADETLHDLIEFSKFLQSFSQSSAEQIHETDFFVQFDRLIDGISTFTEAISSVKRILKLGLFNSIQNLEIELLAILTEISTHREANNREALYSLLNEQLPSHLQKWREQGLPSLIRSRDS